MDKIANQETHNLQGSNGVYWGLVMFAGVTGFLGWWIDTPILEGIFYGITALLGGGAAFDKTFYQKHEVDILPEGLHIRRGLVQRTENILLNEIEKVELVGENEVLLGNFKDYDLENNNLKIKKLRLILAKKSKNLSADRKLEFDSYDYEDIDFLAFVKFFQLWYKNITITEEEKLLSATQKSEKLLKNDKQLAAELVEAMQETYRSVYQTHIIYTEQENKEFVKEQLKNLAVLYSYTPDEKTYYYFLQDDFLPEIDETEKQTAQTLIDASLTNLAIVQNRIQAYRQVQEKLEKTVKKAIRQNKLQNVATKLGNLQERNMQHLNTTQNLDFEADVFEQLNELLQQIQKTETAEQAVFLKEYILEFEKLTK